MIGLHGRDVQSLVHVHDEEVQAKVNGYRRILHSKKHAARILLWQPSASKGPPRPGVNKKGTQNKGPWLRSISLLMPRNTGANSENPFDLALLELPFDSTSGTDMFIWFRIAGFQCIVFSRAGASF